MRTGTIFKLVVGIGVGMGISVPGTVGDGCKYVPVQLSNLSIRHMLISVVFVVVMVAYVCSVSWNGCWNNTVIQ